MSNCYNAAMHVKRDLENAHKVYVSYSGGKDSTAMLIRLLEKGVHIDEITFADTGEELPEMYEFLELVERTLNVKIVHVKAPEGTFRKWYYGTVTDGANKGEVRGFPLYAFPCWFTREGKIVPLKQHMVDAKTIYIGYAADEHKRHHGKSRGEDGFTAYPLVDWGMTEEACAKLCEERGLLCPLYKNFSRLGCYFCPKQPIQSWYALWKIHPNKWADAIAWDDENYRVKGRGIWRESLRELQARFESGYVPPKLPKYADWCTTGSCDAIANAFSIKQTKLERFIARAKERAKELDLIQIGART